ncbi:hypothetical protein VTJ04DRAFT_4328 [Mycothermus thermophilus]|uniref:uncharacterized protein n=1 Tax=Humicola insolens TaxID=85995 RepID=UPI0037430944
MPTKKKTEAADNADETHARHHGAPSMTPSVRPKIKPAAAPQPPLHSPQVLVICRNKHWRYISSFHGPWLQLPPEILETIANANYNTPRPRPIDPAVFFDLIKIRRLVDDATNLAVRAASGVASIGQRNVPGASHHAAALGFGFGLRPPPQTKLSAERKHKMREQATQKLMEAYRLDEIACSVATMQSTSSLEEVASWVLQRNPQDPDAKYVHFFHEKIPSRQLAQCTSLTPLNEIATAKPTDPEPLRTRAMVRVFKGDYQGAIDDLTEALKLYRLYRPAHPSKSVRERSLHVPAGLSLDSPVADGRANGETQHQEGSGHERSPAETEAGQRKMAEARRLVRHNAKRALRDYTAYLSHFEYSPDMPIAIAEEFTRKVNSAVHGGRPPRSSSHALATRSLTVGSEGEESAPHHRIYALSDLFTSSPPSGLPPYPSTDLVVSSSASAPPPTSQTTESLTCHPLLAEALHSLLLCHALIQTSAKELLRHAYMVARLVRLADGYPVFQSSRCPARADWVEVLRAAGNWINLVGSWDELCAPAASGSVPQKGSRRSNAPLSLPSSSAVTVTGTEGDSAALPATESSTAALVTTSTAPSSEDANVAQSPASIATPPVSAESLSHPAPPHQQKELQSLQQLTLPLATDRAAAIARWVIEVPPLSSSNNSEGAAKRRRRKPGPSAGRKASEGGAERGDGDGSAAGQEGMEGSSGSASAPGGDVNGLGGEVEKGGEQRD